MKKFITLFMVIMLLTCFFTACKKQTTTPSSGASSSVISSEVTSSEGNSNIETSNSSSSDGPSQNQFNIDIENQVGGNITASKETANVGEVIFLDVTLSPNYYLISLKFNGQDITSQKSFTMPNADVKITVVYGYNPHWTEEA